MADTHEFLNVDAEKWERIKAKLAIQGVTVDADQGDASHKGIELSWSYNPALEYLKITLVKRAFYDPSTATIDADIEQWISAA